VAALSSVTMEHKDDRARFLYENAGRLTGDLERASWLIDQTAWALCPLVPIPDPDFTDQLRHPTHAARMDAGAARQWVQAGRHDIQGFHHAHATFTMGIESFMSSAIQRADRVFSLPHTYYHVPDLCALLPRPHHTEVPREPALCILELPTPHHPTREVTALIAELRSLGHRVVMDMTFMPVARERITVDVSEADEIWISMNKAWDTGSLRPAWRFSREPVPDALTLAHDRQRYSEDSLAAWCHMVATRGYDHVFDQHANTYDHVCARFDLTATNNLLAARKQGITWEHMYTPNWNYNDLVGTHNLIAHSGRHFW
jgi:hypothetical protein